MHIFKDVLETLMVALNRSPEHRVKCLATDLTTLSTRGFLMWRYI